ncbi:hypothetical protein CASFOL_009609 [Castilleja foliolosa]|uniref:ATPase F1/V1/A1 complex alpha/beta subunit N-terminal domain-containing protein n=1 Tax=Castilleja foliolosa TaxID=1961234 RepID=A0ABD3DYH5_9LAMI
MDPLEVGSSQTNLGSELPWLIRYQMPFRLLLLLDKLLKCFRGTLFIMRINPTASGSGVSTLEKKTWGVSYRPNHRSGTRCRDTVGQAINVTCEVQQLLGNNRVRAVAMSATDGLMRGMEVVVKLLWINR